MINDEVGRVYIIKNDVNNMVYIGQTTATVKERLKEHKKNSTRSNRSNYKLYSAMNEIGVEHFYAETLEDNVPKGELGDREIFYISKYDSFKNGYNGTKGGKGGASFVFENERQELLELAKSGKTATELAKIYGVHVATIFRTLKPYGFHFQKETDEDAIVRMFNSGCGYSEICEVLEINKMTVGRHLRKRGLRRRNVYVNCRNDFPYESLKTDYYRQMSLDSICNKYGITRSTFARIRYKEKWETRPKVYYKRLISE